MRTRKIASLAAVFSLFLIQTPSMSQENGHGVVLHVNPRWKECSFQLDPSLTQEAWHQFTEEAGLVAYFRPLTGAKPAGAGTVEVSLLQWATNIDDRQDAWNNTFVHPDSAHWLMEGDRLAFPGLMARVGLTDRLDAAAYVTRNFNANYGFWGGMFQYAALDDSATGWAASARISAVSIFGPEDFDFVVFGAEVVAEREFPLSGDWLSLTPYAGVSTYLSNAHETTGAVDLADEHVTGFQGMVGAVTRVSVARLAVEYNAAAVSTISMKVGVEF